jgi:hypothetical protein
MSAQQRVAHRRVRQRESKHVQRDRGDYSAAAGSVGLARDGDRRRREHLQQICWQCFAGMPVLEPDEAAVARIVFTESEFGFCGDDGAWVVALEAQPCDVGMLVVVAVDLPRFYAGDRDDHRVPDL